MNGKGDKPRPIADREKYNSEFDRIFRKAVDEFEQVVNDFIDFNESNSIKCNGRRLSDKEKDEIRIEAESIFLNPKKLDKQS